jgi:hypothetical protein
MRTSNTNLNIRYLLCPGRLKAPRDSLKFGAQVRLSTAFLALLAELKMACFFSSVPDSERFDRELRVDSDCVDGSGTNGNVLVEHCGAAVVDFGLPALC